MKLKKLKQIEESKSLIKKNIKIDLKSVNP